MWKQAEGGARRPCDSTSGNLNKTSVTEKSRRVFASRLSFSELFDDISLMLNVRRLCVVVDSLISAAKVCHCVISAWYVVDRYVIAWLFFGGREATTGNAYGASQASCLSNREKK